MRRRRFFQSLSSILAVLTAAALALPGIGFLFDPLRRHGASHKRRPVAKLKDLPLNEPRKIVLRDRRRDAWIRYPEGPIGAVWIVRRGEREVVAFSAVCPHLGCAVDYAADRQQYLCPCHEAVFTAEGSTFSGPQQRGLDRLHATIEKIGGEEWVSVVHERFQSGTAEQIPLG